MNSRFCPPIVIVKTCNCILCLFISRNQWAKATAEMWTPRLFPKPKTEAHGAVWSWRRDNLQEHSPPRATLHKPGNWRRLCWGSREVDLRAMFWTTRLPPSWRKFSRGKGQQLNQVMKAAQMGIFGSIRVFRKTPTDSPPLKPKDKPSPNFDSNHNLREGWVGHF